MIVLRIATRCSTVDDFVAVFRKWCTDTTCFIPTRDQRSVGLELGFSIRLADDTPVLRGLAVVLASYETSDNAYRRPGLLLGIRKLTAQTEPVFRRMRLGDAPPIANAIVSVIVAAEHSGKIVASRAEVADMVRPTTQMAPLFPEETRTPGSPFVLPANPLMDETDATVDAFVNAVMCECSDDDAIPADLSDDSTVPTARPHIATILGVAPLVLIAPAAPAAIERAPVVVTTDAIARIRGVEPIDVPYRRWHAVRELLGRVGAWLREPAGRRRAQRDESTVHDRST